MNETHPSIEQIVDYLHGELCAADDAAMHAHLAGCPSCEARRGEEITLSEVLRAHAKSIERELPAGVVARIHDAVARPHETLWEKWRAALRPAVVLPAAAAVVAFVLYLGFGLRHTAAPAIAASYYVDRHAAFAGSAPLGDDAPMPPTLTTDDETH
jgi:anti-sigma factor RsiW